MTYYIKVVRNDKPNEPGRWIEISDNLPLARGWSETEYAVDRFVPAGCHLVQVSRRKEPNNE